jgi:hypothetical protein
MGGGSMLPGRRSYFSRVEAGRPGSMLPGLLPVEKSFTVRRLYLLYKLKLVLWQQFRMIYASLLISVKTSRRKQVEHGETAIIGGRYPARAACCHGM